MEVASASYRLTTDGHILDARTWQDALYSQLSSQTSEAGYLLTTPTGAGKTEAVVIPSLGLQRGGAPRRLFLVGHDGTTLDDHLERLIPYLRASASADNVPRTLYLDTPETEATGQTCVRFCPDGSEDRSIALNPLEADVDLVLTTFTRFGDLFFGAGGVHGLLSRFTPEDGASVRRDLFFFDEAHDYGVETFDRFLRLVKFLFAQDTDIVVASSTMPAHYRDELGFLEFIEVGIGYGARERAFTWKPAIRPLAIIKQEIRRVYAPGERVFGVVEHPEDAEMLYERLAPLYPESVFLYHPGQKAEARRRIYSQLSDLEKEDMGYILLTTGDAIETSDLNATYLFTTFCPPENLILRAGRCNRRGDSRTGHIMMIGEEFDRLARSLCPTKTARYKNALAEQDNSPFDADFWKTFV